MTNNRNQNQTDPGEVDQDIRRVIRYLDPDGARDWHYLAFIFGCTALVILVLAIAAWVN
jgi:hypothetical protein